MTSEWLSQILDSEQDTKALRSLIIDTLIEVIPNIVDERAQRELYLFVTPKLSPDERRALYDEIDANLAEMGPAQSSVVALLRADRDR